MKYAGFMPGDQFNFSIFCDYPHNEVPRRKRVWYLKEHDKTIVSIYWYK